MKPIEKYLITGNFDLLPIASKTPIGKQKIIEKTEINMLKTNLPKLLFLLPPNQRIRHEKEKC